MAQHFGIYGASLLGSREIAIRSVGAQVILCNYNEDGFIAASSPLFYIMTVMLNASKVLDMAGSKLTTEYLLLNINIDGSGNIRLIAQAEDFSEGKQGQIGAYQPWKKYCK